MADETSKGTALTKTQIRADFPRAVREIENTWIKMPDGVRLAARIWLPKDAKSDPVPAILEYLPYRKRDGTVERDALTHPYFAGHGYAGVRVDMRGSGDSEGLCFGEYLKQEQDDALAVLEWLAAQPWCSGRIGMIGISWGGFNGLQIAARRPPELGAVISICSTDDRYADDIHFMGGAVLCDKLNWASAAFSILSTPPDPAIVGKRWREMWLNRLENTDPWGIDWFRHQRRDEFYAHGSICENYADVEVPVYMVGGWADGYTNSVFRAMEHLPGPKKGLIGPWGHKYPHFALPGPQIGFLQECLRWWDQHLKGVDTGIMDEPPLRVWLQDPAPPAPFRQTRSGRWVAEPGWSGKALETTTLHPGPSGLSDAPQGGKLTISSPQNAGVASGAWCGYGVVADGPLDQNGENGLLTSFESEPLEDVLILLGFPMLHAEVESNAPQANLVATLSSVSKNGRATLISYGVLNLTHRNGHASPEPMPLGTAVPIELRLNACGQRVAKGHRLRLSLGTAYWPVIWPSQSAAVLKLTNAKLELPLRGPRDIDAHLADFEPPETAPPMKVESDSKATYERSRRIDHVTGEESIERTQETGFVVHPDNGLMMRETCRETFRIHPDDPHSAVGICRWHRAYARGEWRIVLGSEISVRAWPEVWRVDATLIAEDADGEVSERTWSEEIPRDLV